ncbi:MAG TPA: ATP-binding protein, partial [Thermoanaerobaculia bacterium]|nr:ATP-binding protein [Thermoanaerobaculia bacterium]
ALASRFGAPWVPEFCRGYQDVKGSPLDASDVEPIARGQIAEANAAERLATDLVVLDTDLVSTVVYARHYYGACPAWIEEACRERRADLYLLCAPDLPWVADGQRDRGDRREEVHRLFSGALGALGACVELVEGEGPAREEAAGSSVFRTLMPGRAGGGVPAAGERKPGDAAPAGADIVRSLQEPASNHPEEQERA